MKLSAQQEYGLRCMVQMARANAADSVNIESIAEREALTPAYVAKLMRILRNAGLIVSIRGQHGGYRLARSSQELSVQEILLALGERLFGGGFCARHSGNSEHCVHNADCSLRALWSGLDHVLESFLAECRLSDLVAPEATTRSWTALHLQKISENMPQLSGAGRATAASSCPEERATPHPPQETSPRPQSLPVAGEHPPPDKTGKQ